MGSEVKNTVYVGAFVHSVSPSELDVCQKGAIGVDSAGKIAFVERNVENIDECIKKHGWEGATVVQHPGEGFFFPGFIGILSLAGPIFLGERVLTLRNQILIYTPLNIPMLAFSATQRY
jgi:hypothetical protein